MNALLEAIAGFFRAMSAVLNPREKRRRLRANIAEDVKLLMLLDESRCLDPKSGARTALVERL